MAYDEDTPFELIAVTAALFGPAVARKVNERFAGREVWVPKSYSSKNQLCKIIGETDYPKLAAELGGLTMEVSSAIRSEARRNRISRLSRLGMLNADIATLVGITERRVYQIRRELIDQGVLPVRARRLAKGLVAGSALKP